MPRGRSFSTGTLPRGIEAAIPLAAAILLKRKLRPSVLAPYHNDPVAFIHDMIIWPEGDGLTPYQEDILAHLPTHGRVAAYGPHGLGKTTMEALGLLWFSLTRDTAKVDWKNPTLASVWRQLEKFLWPEVHKWSKRLNWAKLGVEPWTETSQLLAMAIKLDHGESFALASDQPSSLEGAHADSLFYTFDESKAIPADSWDAVEGAFSGAGSDVKAEAFALACSTPGEEQGRFYEICTRKPGFEDWYVRRVTIDEAIAAGRVSRQWVEARRLQWGEGSVVFKNRVLGEFASSDSTGVIPLAWVERAVDFWNQNAAAIATDPRVQGIGIDVGGGKSDGDMTTFALRRANTITEIRRYGRGDTMETVGRIQGVLNGQPYLDDCIPVVDSIGVGAGVVARLRELDVPVVPFNAAEGTDRRDHSGELGFANKRAWAWWNLREMLDPSSGHDVALPPDDLLIGDLTAPRWRVLSGGKILIESKDEIRKRIGRSTDTGDAAVMVMASLNLSTDAEEPLVRNAGLEAVTNEYRRQVLEDYGQGNTSLGDLFSKEF
jgi:hypothetical protein